MAQWLRYAHQGVTGFGTVESNPAGVLSAADAIIQVFEGDMFAGARATDRTLRLADVKLLAPCVPTKMPALWNNFYARAAKEGIPLPADPLYFLKGNNSFCAHGDVIKKPAHFNG